MSRITQKSAVAPLNPWAIGGTNPNYAGTATPVAGNQAYSANPGNNPITTAGTGFADPNFDTYVGQKFDTSDGRELVLVQNGVVALTAGKLVQAPVEFTAFEKLAMTVPTAYPATAGSFQVLVTNGNTALKQNLFGGGYLVTASSTGIGQTLKIASHQAAIATGTFVVTLEDPIQVTLSASTTVSLIQNPYNGIVISNHSTLGTPVGVTICALAASTAPTYDGTSGLLTAVGLAQYGLIVCGGPTGCLIDNTVTNVGYPLGPSAATDGALGVATLTASPQIAVSAQTQTSAQVGLVYLQL